MRCRCFTSYSKKMVGCLIVQEEQNQSILIFGVGPIFCSVLTVDLEKVVPLPQLNSLPGTTQFTQGVFNYQGKSVPVVNLREKFGLSAEGDGRNQRVIVAKASNQLVGFLVDEVCSVTSLGKFKVGLVPAPLSRQVFSKTLLQDKRLILHTSFSGLYAMQPSSQMTAWVGKLPGALSQPLTVSKSEQNSKPSPSPAESEKEDQVFSVKQTLPVQSVVLADKSEKTNEVERQKSLALAQVKENIEAVVPQKPQVKDQSSRNKLHAESTPRHEKERELKASVPISKVYSTPTVNSESKQQREAPAPRTNPAMKPFSERPEARVTKPIAAQGNSSLGWYVSVLVLVLLASGAGYYLLREQPFAPQSTLLSKPKQQELQTDVTEPLSFSIGEFELTVEQQNKEDSSQRVEVLLNNEKSVSHDEDKRNQLISHVTHTVVEGDTLWDIAIYYLGDPFQYPELAELSHIKDPDLIYPGDLVHIRRYER